jgi:TfoX/Sxy family transcriptional regulator of competence genes
LQTLADLLDSRCLILRFRIPVEVIMMAYDDTLAARVRRALSRRADIAEKSMFGGIAFMVAGNMCCGVNRNDLVIRLPRQTAAEDLGSPHVRAWDLMKRPMPGMFAVASDGCVNQKLVDGWVKLALEYARSLPPRSARAAKKPGRSLKKG